MKEYIVRIKPQTSFERLPTSDTLFGALCWAIRSLYGKSFLENILFEFQKTPSFLISSIFPFNFITQEHLIPKPLLKPLRPEDIKDILMKRQDTLKLKFNVQPYHSEKILEILLLNLYQKIFKKNKWIDIDYIKTYKDSLTERKMFEDFLDGIIGVYDFAFTGAVQKNSIDRLSYSTTGAGNTFYNQEIFFRDRWGLYFLIKTDKFEDIVLPCLKFLEDSGIGPNSKTGKGHFRIIEISETNWTTSSSGDFFVTLSRYIKNENIDLDGSMYSVLPLRSKVESRDEFAGEDIWKSMVMYFSEGSTVKPIERKDIYGTLVPVKSIGKKRIFQYGFAYPLWINIGGNNEAKS